MHGKSVAEQMLDEIQDQGAKIFVKEYRLMRQLTEAARLEDRDLVYRLAQDLALNSDEKDRFYHQISVLREVVAREKGPPTGAATPVGWKADHAEADAGLPVRTAA